jgi:hypothetical protein
VNWRTFQMATIFCASAIDWRSASARFAASAKGLGDDGRSRTVSPRAGDAAGDFACDRDRFACKDFERNWDTMVSSEL